MAARARLQSERSALRKDRTWLRNPQNPRGFEAKPSCNADDTQNLLVWKCSIPGPHGTCWEGGRLPLTLTFTEDYATAPPAAQFKQMPPDFKRPLFHPNVFNDGKVCLSILKQKNWNASLTIKQVLISIQRLLAEPNNNDAAQTEAHKVFANSRAEYERRVKEQVALLKDNDDF